MFYTIKVCLKLLGPIAIWDSFVNLVTSVNSSKFIWEFPIWDCQGNSRMIVSCLPLTGLRNSLLYFLNILNSVGMELCPYLRPNLTVNLAYFFPIFWFFFFFPSTPTALNLVILIHKYKQINIKGLPSPPHHYFPFLSIFSYHPHLNNLLNLNYNVIINNSLLLSPYYAFKFKNL